MSKNIAYDPYEGFLEELGKKSLPYKDVIDELYGIYNPSFELDLETISLLGLDLILSKENKLSLKSRFTPIKKQSFCVLDIEATGSVDRGGLLEIGAVKVKGGEIIDSFSSLIKVDYIPPCIVELTGIDVRMTQSAPRLGSVLSEFRFFLGTDVFVAHNARNDYKYLQKAFLQCDLGPLLNQRLCTLKLARQMIKAPKHGLAFLKEELKIKSELHRALSDATAAAHVLIHCLKKLPLGIKTTQDLLEF